MSRRRVNNPLALAVLGCLIERSMHPYEISTTLRSRGKEKSIKLNYGSLYSVVDALQKHSLIEPKETLREGKRPERTVYAITSAGRAEFEDWLAELIAVPSQDPSQLEAALSLLPGLPPEEAARLLEDRARALQIEERGLAAGLGVAREMGLPELFVIETVFRQAMLAAELAFVRRLAGDIRSSSLPGTKGWRRIHELLAGGMAFEEIMADPVGHLGEEGRALAPPNPHS